MSEIAETMRMALLQWAGYRLQHATTDKGMAGHVLVNPFELQQTGRVHVDPARAWQDGPDPICNLADLLLLLHFKRMPYLLSFYSGNEAEVVIEGRGRVLRARALPTMLTVRAAQQLYGLVNASRQVDGRPFVGTSTWYLAAPDWPEREMFAPFRLAGVNADAMTVHGSFDGNTDVHTLPMHALLCWYEMP